MRIAVTTPTGHVGSRVVHLLLQAGVRPTLLLRDPARLDPAVAERTEPRRGDLTDECFVREATADVDTLFWVDPTPHTAADPVAASALVGRTVADAVRANGISRVVFLSSIGAEKRHGAGHIDGLARIEEQLDATGADVLHLRCGYFFTNLLMDLESLRGGALVTALPADLPLPWVDPRDIGDVAAARLLSPYWSGRQVQAVHGPEDLTFARVAEILTAATGSEITLQRVADDDVRGALRSAGMGPRAVEGIVGMGNGLWDGFTPEQPRTAVTTTPTSLGAWAHATLRPLLDRRTGPGPDGMLPP